MSRKEQVKSTPSTPPKPPSLAKKLANVMAGVHRIQKAGTNAHYNYKFATSEDVADLIRTLLAEQGVAFIPTMVDVTRASNGKMVRTTIFFRFTFRDGDSDDSITCEWFAESLDTQDKGINKAATAAVKYFLLKTFLVSAGDEPDTDREAYISDRAGEQSPTRPSGTQALKDRLQKTKPNGRQERQSNV